MQQRSLLLGCCLAIIIIGLDTKQHTHNIPDHIGRALQDAIEGESIKANLRALTKEPHQAGTKANERVAKTIEKMYTDAGLQKVHTLTYDVLLGYPDWDRPNTVSINDKSGRSIFTSRGLTDPIIPEEQGAPHAGHQWLAYSAPGRVEGDIVYAHSGKRQDFLRLKKMAVDVTGKIVMMRYGESFRGDKIYEAQAHGARAAILFSDPAEAARGGKDDVYPKSVWMPPEGVQRGTIMKTSGDPLTPLYSAKPGAFKARTIDEIKEARVIPSIPALPISYTTAYEILSRMSGVQVPDEWQGGINVTYRLGPGLIHDQKTVVDVKSSLETRHIHNVVGYIPGAEEEDRYVILGNHFDAWVYGSIDPNSGTAILAEVARAMVETMKKTGWRPARSIMFAAWDAEEHGLIGSTEYVEEFVQQLGTRAVAYINMDCFDGNFSLDVDTIPSLRDLAVNVAKLIPNHVEEEMKVGRKTIYDTWAKSAPSDKDGLPEMGIPAGNTDFAAFLTYAGVPVIGFNFVNASRNVYPLYHSLFETPFLNEHLYDNTNFAMHRNIGRYWAELARTLADSPVLPINVTRMAAEISDRYVIELKKNLDDLPDSPNLIEAKQQANLLGKVAEKFLNHSQRFDLHARHAENFNDKKKLRAVNERVMMTERCFINPRGAPGSPANRHVFYAVSDKDKYAGRIMPAVYDAIDEYNETADKKKAGRKVAEQISIIYHSVRCAINTLKHFF